MEGGKKQLRATPIGVAQPAPPCIVVLFGGGTPSISPVKVLESEYEAEINGLKIIHRGIARILNVSSAAPREISLMLGKCWTARGLLSSHSPNCCRWDGL